MKIKILIPFFCCLISSCVGYVKGDLREDQLDQDLTYEFKQKAYVDSVKDAEFEISCNGKTFPVKFEYDIQESSWSTTVMSNLSILTLGLIPLYSTNDLNLKISIYKDSNLFVEENIDSRAHFYYGIIPLWLSSPKGGMNCNEGEGISGCLYRVAQSCSAKRLHRILRENGKLKQLCN